jgi:opacity protein-like surface antigen
MLKNLFSLVTLSAVFALVASAADVTGKWVAQVPGRDGQTRETVFNLKSSGNELTGTVSGFQGNQMEISEGKIDGDNLSFVVKMEFNGNAIQMKYSGVVSGAEIKMKRETQRGAQEFVAKKATS